MTEYEAVSLFYEMINTSNNHLFGYISILSAFLVMSWFAADKLSNVQMVIVLALFSLACVLLIMQINLTRTDMTSLYAHIIELQSGGASSLSWFVQNPPWFVNNIPIVLNLVTIGGYFSCLGFFFYKKGHKESAIST